MPGITRGEDGEDVEELDEETMRFIMELDRKIKARIRERLDSELEKLEKRKGNSSPPTS